MSTPLPPYPDAEAVFMALLAPIAPTVQTLPDDITEDMFRVLRIGGADDGVTDRPLMSVEAFGVSYESARVIAEQARQLLLADGVKAVVVTGYAKPVVIDAIRTVAPPVEAPYDNPTLRRKPATYQAWLRRQL